MRNELSSGSALSDADLVLEVHRLARKEREATAELIAALAELDARRLYLSQGCSSLFTYCTQILHLSEHAAYGRIEAARAARKWPVILDLLADGSLHLTTVNLLAPHLTPENHVRVLAAARHRSKREVEQIVATLRPQPPVASSVRKLPSPSATAPATGTSSNPKVPDASVPRHVPDTEQAHPPPEPARRAIEIRPLAPERYKVQFTVSRETYDKLRHAQDLLRHRMPNGDVAAIFDRALTLLLAELQKTKHAAVARPRAGRPTRSSGRHIPAVVKREVWTRDGGQCAFAGAAGRCTERGFLEYHHVAPFADRGAATVDNIALRCRAHNAYEAELWFGVQEKDLVREAGARFGPPPP